ncbi:MAG TPA: polyphenol oxidase family protein [Acidimicrobiales bacterium]|nr:polyphenol oxidase family protein [Acidimicrobiales bacterium]
MPESEVPLLRWADAGDMGAEVAVTTRHGGVSRPPYDSLNLGLHVGDDPSDVAANRTRAAGAFGVALARLVFARQVHGAGVAVVGGDDAGRGTAEEDDAVADADILVTTTPGLALVIMVADCVPLALIDPEAGVLAVVHAGWRGTAAGVIGAALDAMVEWGAGRERVRAWVGPAVAPDRYQVTDEVWGALDEAVGAATLDAAVARPDGPGHWLVDLVAANRQQLGLGGISAGHITECGVTTADERFFSDRAARPCGRFALMARLAE